jgi:heme-degrading monooxygenase HmoA
MSLEIGGEMSLVKPIVPLLLIIGICFLIFAAPETSHTQTAKPAIARIWQGRVSIAKADEYEKYLTDNGVPKMTSTAGNLGIQILRRPASDAVEFIVITYWESRDAIKKVVGEDIDHAYSLPRDHEFLLEPVKTVRHYQIALSELK